MKLDRALDAFLERSEPDGPLGGKALSTRDKALSTRETEEKVTKALEADLNAIQSSATRWRIFTLLALCGLAASSFITVGAWKALSLASAGGFIALLNTMSRRKFAADLCIALIRAAENADQRVKVVAAIRSRL